MSIEGFVSSQQGRRTEAVAELKKLEADGAASHRIQKLRKEIQAIDRALDTALSTSARAR